VGRGEWTLTLRREGATEKRRAGSLAEALDDLETEARAFSQTERREAATFLRRFEAVDIVALRVQLDGPGVHAGVDVRGEGSAEAWTGRWRRTVIAPREGESAYDALRRAVGA
jgi:uncharacterized protein YlxW (UPF0749 family)